MAQITLSVFGVICFISAAYGTGCFFGPRQRFPIACPEGLDSAKTFCCEISGSFRCCDKEEFAHQEKYLDNPTSLKLRHKRDAEVVVAGAAGLGVAAIIGIIFVTLLPFILCCCCCCACCPCYACCHPGNNTNVTVVNPSAAAAPSSVQNNFCVSVPTQPAMQQQSYTPMQQQPYTPMQQQYEPMPAQQPPPQYTPGDNAKATAPGFVL